MAASDGYAVRAVERTLALLDALADAGDGASLASLARGAGLSEPTALRYLATLVRGGVVEQEDGSGRYRLGLGLLLLWERSVGSLDPRHVAEPYMEALRDEYGETVNLAAFWRGRVVLIEVREGLRAIKMGARVGEEDPLHCTGLGKAILAHLDAGERRALLAEKGLARYTAHTITSAAKLERELARVRERGYAVDEEETARGLRCVAAPVFDRRGAPSYGLSLSAPATSFTAETLHAVGPRLVATAGEISRRLGYTGRRA